jgi:hypothetical protein
MIMAFFYRDEKINHEERHFEREKIDVVCSSNNER